MNLRKRYNHHRRKQKLRVVLQSKFFSNVFVLGAVSARNTITLHDYQITNY
jgi:hypothetical protein